MTLKPNISFEALGTNWYISVETGITPEIEADVRQVLQQTDAIWSRFRPDSLVAKMAQEPGVYQLNEPDMTLIKWYKKLYDATAHGVTPLIGQTLSDAGYDSSYSLTPKSRITTTPLWEESIELGDTTMTIKQAHLIDVGAAGKGYAIDRVAALLKDTHYLIDAGGDIRVSTSSIIGLENPRDSQQLIGKVTIHNQSICGSASNRRAWREWHHIIDPSTSRPVQKVIATWVVAPTAMIADGLATALFFVPPEALSHLADFSYIVMYENGEVYHTNTKDITLFTGITT